ncbi:MAG: AAA family ATPase [Pseudomonadota bacterium]
MLLTDTLAYKIKKPLDLGFLDFSSLAKREACCREEIRLNRRLAPHIYIEAVPVTGSVEHPVLEGQGPVLEWAVKMHAFAPASTLDLEANLQGTQIDAIADRIARFHSDIAPATQDSPWGTAAQVQEPMQQNFSQMGALHPPVEIQALLDRLAPWVSTEGTRLAPHFQARKAAGFVRECHGDLHLGNIAWVDDAPLIFDCIEFNPGLRFIDVISEMAFLAMDLCHRGHDNLAWQALNRYLEHTGDYAGLAALAYYMVYRAMVRAKVAALRARQENSSFGECRCYLELALRLTQPPAPALILMHGVSGSGKTVVSQQLLESLPAVRLRSDVERKRLFGLPPLGDSRAIPGGIYAPEASTRTRERLLAQSALLLQQGFKVIVDATFISPDWRKPFADLAVQLDVPWCWVAPEVPAETLRARVAARAARGDDASEAGPEVLESQLAGQTPLDGEESARCISPTPDWSADRLIHATRTCLAHLALP